MSCCIGPVCVPYYTIMPFLLALCKFIWEWIKTKLLGQSSSAEKKDDGTPDISGSSKIQKLNKKLRKRTQAVKVSDVESVETWDRAMTRSLVFVKFTATWCGPCKTIAPVFSELCATHGHDDCAFLVVDVDEMDDLAANANIRAMPTFHVYHGGKKVDEVVGAQESNIRKLISKYV